MIQSIALYGIIDLSKGDKEMKIDENVRILVSKLKRLQALGYDREATWKVFQELNLPFGVHMYISGNWSALGLK